MTSVCCMSAVLAALQLYAKCEAVLNLSAHTGWLNGITDRHPGEVLAQASFLVRLGAWLLDARSEALVQGHKTAHTTRLSLWVLGAGAGKYSVLAQRRRKGILFNEAEYSRNLCLGAG